MPGYLLYESRRLPAEKKAQMRHHVTCFFAPKKLKKGKAIPSVEREWLF